MADATILKWTGRGAVADLRKAVSHILATEEVGAKTSVLGRFVLVEGGAPTEVANLLFRVPGVEWVAVGQTADSARELSRAVADLSKRYLRKDSTFAVKAESTSTSVRAGDLVGAANSAVLDAVKGARVDEVRPSTTFRVLFDGRHGSAGVELKRGPGGTPVGNEKVSVLVSGGMHSSVVAWLALLSGLQVEMVHAWAGEEAMREVGRLYGELSHRVDPSALDLVVLTGGSARELLRAWTRRSSRDVCSGSHAECRMDPKILPHKVRSPLYLLPEEGFEEALGTLGLKGDGSKEQWKGAKKLVRFGEKRFGGRRADMHGVIDGLR